MVDYDRNYFTLPLIEYATGAVECALARGKASHCILYSKTQFAEGGFYLAFSEVPFEITDKDLFIKEDREKPETSSVTRESAGRFRTQDKAKGKFLKVVDLSEDIEEQLSDIEDVFKKVVGEPFTSQTSPYW